MEKDLLKIGFDKAEAQFFSRFYIGIEDEDKAILDKLGAEFSNGDGVEIHKDALPEKLKPLAEKYNVDERTVHLMFLISNFDLMKKKYLAKSLPGLYNNLVVILHKEKV